MKPSARFASLVTLLWLAPSFALAEPVVPIRLNGPVENRLNLVILGDGYTSSELLKFSTDVDLLVLDFFRESPFAEYASYFNIYRVDVASNESGVDHPERGVMKDTALGGRYNCSGIQRLICVDTGLVNTVVSRSVAPNLRDFVWVLVNDAEYGGSGGFPSVASTHRDVVALMLHEFGHTLGLLADEYTAQPPTCRSDIEPPEVNASRQSSTSVKWSYWIDAGTELPTTGQSNSVPGTYLGAKYCPEGLYRPTFASKMRDQLKPYEQVNSEQIVRRLYNFVGPIEGVSPAPGTLTPPPKAILNFSVTPLVPAGHQLAVRWRLDGQVVGQSATHRLSTSGMSVGSHVLEVEVSDPTTLVRRDPGSVLVERRQWSITITQTTTRSELEEILERWRKN